MKKAVMWLAGISIVGFIIVWGVGGVMILNNDYGSNYWVYVGLVFIVILSGCLIYLKTARCAHCGKVILDAAKYYPYCGKELE